MDVLNDALAIDADFDALFTDDDDAFARTGGPHHVLPRLPGARIRGLLRRRRRPAHAPAPPCPCYARGPPIRLPFVPARPNKLALSRFAGIEYDHVDEEDGEDANPNPWKLVQSRRFGRVRSTVPEVYPPTPPVRISEIEVEWAPKIGSVRAMRKHSQARKSDYVSTPDGPGYYVYPCYLPEGYY